MKQDPNLAGPIIPPAGGDDGGKDDDKGSQKPVNPGEGRSEAYRFDSSALERAAQAAKELERSSMFDAFIFCYFVIINYKYRLSQSFRRKLCS